MSPHNGPQGAGARLAASSGSGTVAAATPPLAPTLAEVVDKVFDRFDADADGLITQAEMATAIDPNATHTDLATRINSLVTQIDGDASGSLDKDEITAAITALDSDSSGTLTRSELPAKPVSGSEEASISLLLQGPHGGRGGRGADRGEPEPVVIADLVEQLFADLDGNADASISLAELLAHVDTGHKIDFTALASEAFTQLDTNADQGLSAAEIGAALAAVDSNQNGSIDPGELTPELFDQASIELIGLLVHEFGGPGFGGHGGGHGFGG